LAEFPTLSEEDVRAVVAFAAASAIKDLPPPGPIPPELGDGDERRKAVADELTAEAEKLGLGY
jgi:hypothetical protein